MDTKGNYSQSYRAMLLRMLDANLNRAGEGLRILEDIARLCLDDISLTQQLKNIRHRIEKVGWSNKLAMLSERNADTDIGACLDAATTTPENVDLGTLTVANSRRTEQAFRVIEEISKTGILDIEDDLYRESRFKLYSIEKELTSRLSRLQKKAKLSSLAVRLDSISPDYTHQQMARILLDNGASVIFFGNKGMTTSNRLDMACDLKKLCQENDALFIVNHNLDIALACQADGLYLEQEDIPVCIARRHLSSDTLIGISVESTDEAIKAQSEGADYVIKDISLVERKQNKKTRGMSELKQIRETISIPVVAFGDINSDNIELVLSTGVNSVCVATAGLLKDDPAKMTCWIASQLLRFNSQTVDPG